MDSEKKIPGLGNDTVRSGFWVMLARFSEKGLSFIKLVILARLLAPDDFGILGIALLTVAAVEMFSQTGFEEALIQKRDAIDSYLDTAWSLTVIRGLLICLVLFLLGPYVALFFKSPDSASVIQALGFVPLIQSLGNIGLVYFLKELAFHRYFIYQICGTVTDFAVSVILALVLENVWALVFGMLAGMTCRLLVSYMLHSHRPAFRLIPAKARELFSFGRWIFASRIVNYFLNQGDDFVVGKLLGTPALGLYQMAFRVSNLPTTEITHIISRVTFPVYSRLQNHRERLTAAYLNVLQVNTLLAFPAAALIYTLSPEFVSLVLGEAWKPMVPAMQILAIRGMIRSVGASSGPLFKAVGKPEIIFRMQTLRLCLLAVLIFPLTNRFGLSGAAAVVLLCGLITRPVSDLLIIRELKLSVSRYFKTLFWPLSGSLLLVGSVYLTKILLPSGTMFYLVAAVTVGMIGYAGYILLCDILFKVGLRERIRRILTGAGQPGGN